MYKISLHNRVIKTIKNLPPKHQIQIKKYILDFQQEPNPHDSKTLKGFTKYKRADCGEYRIIYKIDESDQIIYIILIGKRNGDEVYQKLIRITPK
jgi:mRNA interferase RelE/StbE